jgi:hypothetical protein
MPVHEVPHLRCQCNTVQHNYAASFVISLTWEKAEVFATPATPGTAQSTCSTPLFLYIIRLEWTVDCRLCRIYFQLPLPYSSVTLPTLYPTSVTIWTHLNIVPNAVLSAVIWINSPDLSLYNIAFQQSRYRCDDSILPHDQREGDRIETWHVPDFENWGKTFVDVYMSLLFRSGIWRLGKIILGQPVCIVYSFHLSMFFTPALLLSRQIRSAPIF